MHPVSIGVCDASSGKSQELLFFPVTPTHAFGDRISSGLPNMAAPFAVSCPYQSDPVRNSAKSCSISTAFRGGIGPRWYRRTASAVFLCLLFGTACGCRLFHAEHRDGNDGLSRTVLQSLRDGLNRDDWRRRNAASLLQRTENVADWRKSQRRPRWEFQNTWVQAMLDRLENDSPPLPSQSTADESLQRVAGEDSLSGWNALILLAQRSPERALPLVDRLQQLVADRIFYEATSGRRVNRRNPAEPVPSADSPNADSGGDKNRSASSSDNVWEEYSLEELIAASPGKTEFAERPPGKKLWERFIEDMIPAEPRAANSEAVRPVSAAMRNAAAEAWCRVLARRKEPSKRAALAPVGHLLRSRRLRRSLREELTLGVARHIPPAEIPGITDALSPKHADSDKHHPRRMLAIKACLLHAMNRRERTGTSDRQDIKIWPRGIHELRNNPSAEIRQLYGRWAAAANVPEAVAVLDLQSRRDIEKSVRAAAIVSLSLLPSREARRKLRRLADDENIGTRVAAVRGLAHWGPRELARLVGDESETVRVEIAEQLADHATPESAAVIEKLLKDEAVAVQKAALTSLKTWPDDAAIPVLLQAMRHGSSTLAGDAWRSLLTRRAEVTGFPVNGNAKRRGEAVRRLVERYQLPGERNWPMLSEVIRLRPQERADIRAAIERNVAVLARQPGDSKTYREAVDRLRDLDRDAVPLIERWIADSLGSAPRRVYRSLFGSVLPELHPVYAALHDLEQRRPDDRWQAVQRLAELGRKASLSPLMVETLRKRITGWRNRVVWRYALQAVMNDGLPESDRLAVEASQFPAASVRVLACEYFRRHPRTKFAGRILELMNDRDRRSVRLAAVRAAGFCHHQSLIDGKPETQAGRFQGSRSLQDEPAVIPARHGLQHWIRSGDREIAEAAAVSLARLGNELGYRELHRMSFHPDAKRRTRAYRLMGETGQKRFLAHLIERGRSEEAAGPMSAILAAVEELTGSNERPVGLSGVSGYHERIGVWSEWLKRRSADRRRLDELKL